MEEPFRSSEIVFFNEPSILASGNGFSINYKLCAFIRSFFLLVDTILKLGANIFSSIFSIPASAQAVFPASGNKFFYLMLDSFKLEWIFCLVFFYSEQILC